MILAMDTISLILAALAVARITRIITEDRIMDGPRNWVIRTAMRASDKFGAEIAYLTTCPWCASMYAGAGAGAAWWAWGDERWFMAVCAALAFSYVTGWLAGRESEA